MAIPKHRAAAALAVFSALLAGAALLQHEHEPIPPEIWPDAIAVHTVRDGAANDPDVYEGGELPNAATVLLVDHNIAIDGDLTIKQLWVRTGSTTLLEGAHLHAHGSIVNGATFQYNAANVRVSFYVPDDRLFEGNNDSNPFPALPDFKPDTDIGYWGLPGSANLMRGIKRQLPWCGLEADAEAPRAPVVTLPGFVDPYQWNVSKLGCYTNVAASGGQMTVDADPVGWKVGDELLICNTSREKTRTTITAINGRQVSFADQSFVGQAVWYTNWLGEITLAGVPHVANLTCSAVWDAPLVTEADPHHRPHVAFLHGSHVHVEDSRFENFGPQNKLGRYPLHLHHGEALHDDGMRRNVVLDSHTRGIVIHRYTGHHCEWNVVAETQGDGIFLEELNETGNTITHNFVTGAMGDAGRNGVLPKGRADNPTLFSGAPVGIHSHGIWGGAGNVYEDNYQHGCNAAVAVMENSETDAEPLVRRNTSHACLVTGPWGSARFVAVDNDVLYCSNGNYVDMSGRLDFRPEIEAHQDLHRSRFILCGNGPGPYPPFPEFVLDGCVIRARSILTTETEKFAFFNCDAEALMLVPNPRRFQFAILFDSSRVKIHNQIWGGYEHPFNPVSVLGFWNCTGSIMPIGAHGFNATVNAEPVTLDDKPYYGLAYSNGKLLDGPFLLTDVFHPIVLSEPLPPAGTFRLQGKLPQVDVGGVLRYVNEYAVVRKGVTTELAWDQITHPSQFYASRFGFDFFEHNGYFGYPPGDYELHFRHSANTTVEVVKELTIESGKLTLLAFP